MKRLRLPPRLILPTMICVGIAIVGLRVGDVWDSLSEGKLFPPVTQAQAEETKAKASPSAKEEAPKQETKGETNPDLPPPPLTNKDRGTTLSPDDDVYKQLAGRREQLDKRARDLDDREVLIKVAEDRVDQKVKEMEALRVQIQTLLGQANAAQQAQIENLVKIYEIMKPKEAAKIFETLEMPILLGVVQKMKPARTAAVLAEMNPQKAKDITTALTKQDQLPQAK